MAQGVEQQPFVYERRRDWTLWLILAFVLLSLVAHVVLFRGLQAYADAQQRNVPLNQPIEMVMVEVEPPKPPPPPPPEVKKEEPPPPKPVRTHIKPPPVKVAETEKPPPPPKEDAPPPPNEEAAKEPPKPVPLVVGISMSSTTATGGFAAPVGNTAYGKTSDTAQDPSKVHVYKAPKYVPSYQADSQPEALGEVQIPYPPEAKRNDIEGNVVMSVSIDADGKVTAVKVLSGPGYGLNEAAMEAVKRMRWKPATKGGENVATQITWTYQFVLD